MSKISDERREVAARLRKTRRKIAAISLGRRFVLEARWLEDMTN